MPRSDGAAFTVAIRKTLRDFELRVDVAFTSGVTVIVGPSGSGKTMLLRTMAGLERPDVGHIAIGERLVERAPQIHVAPKERGVGFVFQDYALFPHLSVTENVAYGLCAHRIPKPERDRRVAAMLERLDIAPLARERPRKLSSGQRQRVALARALVIEPQALFLDEPLAALDVLTRSRVRAELARLLTGYLIPTLLVSHDPADAAAFGGRVLVIERGTVIADAPYSSLRGSTQTAFLATFSEM
ncbi:MAG: ATP-binding cassette domain-containing protein [Candidatus Eremiobacteraeota bacterium]|nr:ATP-binding cassette domain-containing protein [Candidatus Eremiobacteraeota bacterium]